MIKNRQITQNKTIGYFIYSILIIATLITLYKTHQTIRTIDKESEAEMALMEKQTDLQTDLVIQKNNDPIKLVKLGLALNKDGKNNLATIALKKACELDPKWRDSQWALTLAYASWANELSGTANHSQQEEFEKRKKLIREALKKTLLLDPTYQPAIELAKQLQ